MLIYSIFFKGNNDLDLDFIAGCRLRFKQNNNCVYPKIYLLSISVSISRAVVSDYSNSKFPLTDLTGDELYYKNGSLEDNK